jgi:hypothetical protein
MSGRVGLAILATIGFETFFEQPVSTGSSRSGGTAFRMSPVGCF